MKQAESMLQGAVWNKRSLLWSTVHEHVKQASSEM